ncbi:hypothetical protein PSQ90_04295 [Devosia rhodophyticola]|uniref:Uncharacterized protein n=1 Tax=Devosia rhodophyticola TaxID=3026423 RepID=A0ABY7Z030_9HYPH|nr:hypothetical protein [Devosia rhodophyticola]WDR06688.1 hypothetical protein PSQ90_04295 [Devosia rhodophyticola]
MPEFLGVCEEVEGGSISFAKAPDGLTGICNVVGQNGLLCFQFFDLALVSVHDGIASGIDDALKQLIDLAGHCPQFLAQVCGLTLNALGLRVPQVAEHLRGKIEEPFGWAQLAE